MFAAGPKPGGGGMAPALKSIRGDKTGAGVRFHDALRPEAKRVETLSAMDALEP